MTFKNLKLNFLLNIKQKLANKLGEIIATKRLYLHGSEDYGWRKSCRKDVTIVSEDKD